MAVTVRKTRPIVLNGDGTEVLELLWVGRFESNFQQMTNQANQLQKVIRAKSSEPRRFPRFFLLNYSAVAVLRLAVKI